MTADLLLEAPPVQMELPGVNPEIQRKAIPTKTKKTELLSAPKNAIILSMGHNYIPGEYMFLRGVRNEKDVIAQFMQRLRALPEFSNLPLNDTRIVNDLIKHYGLVILLGDEKVTDIYSETESVSVGLNQKRAVAFIFPDGYSKSLSHRDQMGGKPSRISARVSVTQNQSNNPLNTLINTYKLDKTEAAQVLQLAGQKYSPKNNQELLMMARIEAATRKAKVTQPNLTFAVNMIRKQPDISIDDLAGVLRTLH